MDKDIFVNLGRVVLINFGPFSGKLAVIVDIINGTKVVVDGTSFGVPRNVISNKRLTLTKFSLPDVTPLTSTKDLEAKIKAFGVADKFSKTGLGQKIRKQQVRAKLTDFDRFKVYQLKKKLGRVVRTHINKNRATIKKAAAEQKGSKTDKQAPKAAPKAEKPAPKAK